MQVTICCMLLVLYEVKAIVAYGNTLNNTKNGYWEQLRTTKVARKLLYIKDLQEKRKTNCLTARTSEWKQKNSQINMGQELQHQTILFTDCNEIYKMGHANSDVYQLWVNQLYRFTFVYCDMDVRAVRNQTGWITIQRRINGEINFDRGWKDYVDGFGNVRGEYWIGLEHIHALSNQNTTTNWFGAFVTLPRMRIDFEDQDGVTAYAEYELFKVAGANKKYRLIAVHLDKATAIPAGVPTPISTYWFSTYDNNNAYSNCPQTYHGGWWFLACGESNLNGPYPQIGDKNSPSNIYWYDWYTVNENNTAFKSVSMKFQY
uniref:Self-incompatibility-linked fibrinogen-like protein-A n=1 Tax=Ciona intestinalis TaxID=7719 RepID=A0A143RFV0_CIOIN|nr:self-incompatibility-linked fibrinogen-like protein-A [Ciona intestinalis]